MPELPDVENFKNYFNKTSAGRKIARVKVLRSGTARNPSEENLSKSLVGKTFKEAKRRGKFMLASSDGQELVFHFRMTGNLIYEPDGAPIEPDARLIFTFDNGQELRYLDRRNIGEIYLVRDHDFSKTKGLGLLEKLGPEPLSNEFTLNYLTEILKKGATKPVKSLLMDQEKIAGIGNLYADEILFQANVNPLRNSGSLSKEEIQRLYSSVKDVLKQAIKVNADTSKLPSFLLAHRRGGGARRGQDDICPKCGDKFKRVKLAGRTTVFCERDQK